MTTIEKLQIGAEAIAGPITSSGDPDPEATLFKGELSHLVEPTLRSPQAARFRRVLGRIGLAFSLLTSGGVVMVLEAGSAQADATTQEYTVDLDTAAGGIYARAAPESDATQAASGYGV